MDIRVVTKSLTQIMLGIFHELSAYLLGFAGDQCLSGAVSTTILLSFQIRLFLNVNA